MTKEELKELENAKKVYNLLKGNIVYNAEHDICLIDGTKMVHRLIISISVDKKNAKDLIKMLT